MDYQYYFDPVAADEYEEAVNWYEQRSHVASDNFIIAVQDALAAICANPYRFRNVHKNLRELSLKKISLQFDLFYR